MEPVSYTHLTYPSADSDTVTGFVTQHKEVFSLGSVAGISTNQFVSNNELYVRNYAPFNIFRELENNYLSLDVVDMKFQGEVCWPDFFISLSVVTIRL